MTGAYLVTGASKGIGRAIAKEIAAAGFPVIALARESIDLGVTGAELANLNSNSLTISCDLGDGADIAAAAKIIASKYSHLSGIVHNAGMIGPIEHMLEVGGADWARSIQVNLIGVQDLTNRLSSMIGDKNHTRIVTVSSGAAKRAVPHWSAYCVAKAGLDMWTMCMAEEGESKNISAMSISPGIVDTEMQVKIRAAEKFPLVDNFRSYHSTGELSAPGDVAKQFLPYCIGRLGGNGQRLDVRDL